jgi:hypothetical protein
MTASVAASNAAGHAGCRHSQDAAHGHPHKHHHAHDERALEAVA